MTMTAMPSPGVMYAESEASEALKSLEWVRAQGWMHGEFLHLVGLLARAYSDGYAHAVEFVGEDCPIEDCGCTCH